VLHIWSNAMNLVKCCAFRQLVRCAVHVTKCAYWSNAPTYPPFYVSAAAPSVVAPSLLPVLQSVIHCLTIFLHNEETHLLIVRLWFINRDPRLQRLTASTSYILEIGSGQRILYRLGSGLWLVPVLVLRRSPVSKP